MALVVSMSVNLRLTDSGEMKKHPLKYLIASTFALVFAINPAGAADQRGSVTGGIAHEMPGWFKDSFLEMADDAAEAGEADKHVLIFFNLNDCPYCARMLDESFNSDPNMGLIQTHFDAIALNVLGDREVVFNDDLTVTEKQLAEALEVRATPGVMFLDADNKLVARADGYRAPERFRRVLEYVSSKSYRDMMLDEFIHKNSARDVYALRDNSRFTYTDDLSSIQGPLMVVLEDGGCYDCAEFHDAILADDRMQEALDKYTVVRLDSDSDQQITDPDGDQMTPAEFAHKQQMFYRPGVLVYDDGKLIRRMDSLIYPHHFKENLRYVSGGYYQSQEYQAYSEARTEELLNAGIDIDLGPVD